ncbi:MAG: hypothetical protein ABSE49_18320 [Polyangiaceae bacterium]|jgi:hypothetical protein
MATVRARGAVWSLVVSSLLIVACTSNPEEDEVAPACNGVSPTGIQYDQLADGGCLAHPVTLLGSGGEGDSCSEATDCAPAKCTCPGTTTCAWVAECSNGNCLDGDTACCLYGLQCSQ